MKNSLIDMVLDEISLVDNGANPGARIMLFKRATEDNTMTIEELEKRADDSFVSIKKDMNAIVNAVPETVKHIYAETFFDVLARHAKLENARKLHDMVYMLQDSMRSITDDMDKDAATKQELLLQSLSEFKTAVEAELLSESTADEEVSKSDLGGEQTEDDIMTIEELEKRLGEMETENAELKKQLASKAAETEGKDAVIKAGMTPAQLDAFEKMEQANKAAFERISKIEAETQLKDATHKAAASMKNVGKADDLGKLLVDAAKLDAVLAASIEKVLIDADALIEKAGAFHEIGSGNSSASGVVQKVALLAADMRKSDPKLSEAAARGKVWEQNPELKREYDREQRSASH